MLISYLVTIWKWKKFILIDSNLNSKIEQKSQKSKSDKFSLILVCIWALIILTNGTISIAIDNYITTNLNYSILKIIEKFSYYLMSFSWLLSGLMIYILTYYKIYKIETQLNDKIKNSVNLNMAQINNYCESLTNVAILKHECNQTLGHIPLMSLSELFISTVLRISEYSRNNFNYNLIVFMKFWLEYSIILIMNFVLVMIVSFFNESINYLDVISTLNLKLGDDFVSPRITQIKSLVLESIQLSSTVIPNALGFIPIKRSIIISFIGAAVSFSVILIQLL